FQAEDGIRDLIVTGVQTCALPISGAGTAARIRAAAADNSDKPAGIRDRPVAGSRAMAAPKTVGSANPRDFADNSSASPGPTRQEIGRASCRERGEMWGVGVGGRRT